MQLVQWIHKIAKANSMLTLFPGSPPCPNKKYKCFIFCWDKGRACMGTRLEKFYSMNS